MGKQTKQFAGRWFRVYDDAVDEPKLLMLSDRVFRFLISCWCLSSKNNGYLPSIEEISIRVRKSPAAVSGMIAELHERGLLDREANTFTPHNWALRQYVSDTSTPRVKAFRDRHKRGSETVSETFHETHCETVPTVTETPPEQNRTETEQNRHRAETEQIDFARAPLQSRKLVTDVAVPVSEKFEAFWEKYPRKQRRDFASSQWVSLVTRENENAVLECLARYCKSDEVARGVVQNPDKWLYEQQRNGWAGDWPKARSGKTSMEQNVTRTILESLEKGESPW